MERLFVVDQSFGVELAGVFRHKLNTGIPTPYGTVIAFERQVFYEEKIKFVETVVPGIRKSQRPVSPGALEYTVDTLDKEYHDEVSEIVLSRDYKEPVRYW